MVGCDDMAMSHAGRRVVRPTATARFSPLTLPPAVALAFPRAFGFHRSRIVPRRPASGAGRASAVLDRSAFVRRGPAIIFAAGAIVPARRARVAAGAPIIAGLAGALRRTPQWFGRTPQRLRPPPQSSRRPISRSGGCRSHSGVRRNGSGVRLNHSGKRRNRWGERQIHRNRLFNNILPGINRAFTKNNQRPR